MKSLFVKIVSISISCLLFLAGISAAATPPKFPDPAQIKYKPLNFIPPAVDRVVLDNGLALYILEDHELPLIKITALVRTGSMYDPPGKEGLAELTGKLLKTGGVVGMTGNAVDEALESMAATLNATINRDSGLFDLSFLSKDLEKAVDIFSRILMKPAVEEAKLTLAKDLKIGELRRISDDPQKLAFREFGRLIHAGSPRGRLVTGNSINSIHREDLLNSHNQFYQPDRVMISISGDIDRKTAEFIAKQYFGGWKPSALTSEAPPLPHPQEGGIFFLPKDVPQSVIIFGWIAPSKHDQQFYPFEIIDFLIGSGGFRSKMFQEIRTDRGLAYSTGSFYTAKSEYGLFGAYAFTKSESTADVISLIRGIITDINEKPVRPEELKEIKNAILNSFIFSFTSSDRIAFQQMMTEFEALPADYLITYREKIDNVTAEDIRKAAHHLDLQRAIVLIVGNESITKALSESFGTIQNIQSLF